ncbi:hypothetical protein ACI65C_013252 [Semiaphis heraclei]
MDVTIVVLILDTPLNIKPNEIDNTTDASIQSLPIPDDTTLSVGPNDTVNTTDQNMQSVKQTNENFKQQHEDRTKLLENFLNKDQIMALSANKIYERSKETIVKSLKLRFSLGVSGYNYLHETKFPIPSYSTLNRKLQHEAPGFEVIRRALRPIVRLQLRTKC